MHQQKYIMWTYTNRYTVQQNLVAKVSRIKANIITYLNWNERGTGLQYTTDHHQVFSSVPMNILHQVSKYSDFPELVSDQPTHHSLIFERIIHPTYNHPVQIHIRINQCHNLIRSMVRWQLVIVQIRLSLRGKQQRNEWCEFIHIIWTRNIEKDPSTLTSIAATLIIG